MKGNRFDSYFHPLLVVTILSCVSNAFGITAEAIESGNSMIVTEKGPSHITVTWFIPGEIRSSGGTIQYILQYQVAPPNVGSVHRIEEIIPNNSTASYKIQDLEADTVYRITLYAITRARLAKTAVIDEETLPDSPPEPANGLIVTELGSSHITIAWSIRADSRSAGGTIPYYLYYQVAPPNVGRSHFEYIRNNGTVSYTIQDLEAETLYRITLYAITRGAIKQADVYLETLPDSPPEPAKSLIVTEKGSSHITVAWSLPEYSQRNIVQYVLEYQVAPSNVGRVHRVIIPNSGIVSYKILDLEADTIYHITLYAYARTEVVKTAVIGEQTLPDSRPDKPQIIRVETGLDSVNVSFVATARPPSVNPGARFYVKYTKDGVWHKTTVNPRSSKNWVHVTDLDSGIYNFRVVATNGRRGRVRKARSEIIVITIGENRNYVNNIN